ncbi:MULTISPECIES: hypothetical protein [Psychrobacter]|uniref:hypothetical protein n=1 Tax=Psychrobacter TaxID=497 RepID=UPI000EB9C7D2|nr:MULTISPECIES: hypothetical protein [Psychrobacter]HCH26989.1 hypothetical protein [Psychrobacter sp.]
MSKVYIAKQSIGEVRTGGEVKGLTEERAKFLLEKGAIEEAKPSGKAEEKAADTKSKTTKK